MAEHCAAFGSGGNSAESLWGYTGSSPSRVSLWHHFHSSALTSTMTSSRQVYRCIARSSNVRRSSFPNSPSVLARKYRRRQSQSIRPLVRSFCALDLNGSPETRRISTIVTSKSKGVQISLFDPDIHSPAVTATTSPLQKYHTMVETGALRPDDHQTKIIQILQDLYNRLLEYPPPSLPTVAETKSFVRLRFGPFWPGLELNSGSPSSRDYFLATLNLKRKRKFLVVYTSMETSGPGRRCSWTCFIIPSPLP